MFYLGEHNRSLTSHCCFHKSPPLLERKYEQPWSAFQAIEAITYTYPVQRLITTEEERVYIDQVGMFVAVTLFITIRNIALLFWSEFILSHHWDDDDRRSNGIRWRCIYSISRLTRYCFQCFSMAKKSIIKFLRLPKIQRLYIRVSYQRLSVLN